MKVWIAQLLCPSRHCVLGCAGEYKSAEAAEEMRPFLQDGFNKLIADQSVRMNPWCGICQSRELRIEIRATGYATLEEAGPALKASEANQLMSARLLKRGNN